MIWFAFFNLIKQTDQILVDALEILKDKNAIHKLELSQIQISSKPCLNFKNILDFQLCLRGRDKPTIAIGDQMIFGMQNFDFCPN